MLKNLPPPGTEVRTLRDIRVPQSPSVVRLISASTEAKIVRPIGQHRPIDDSGDLFEIQITGGAFQGMLISIRRGDLEEMKNTPPTPRVNYQRS
jgi:hypothetical protein